MAIPYNLTRDDKAALKHLRANRAIVVKSADKGVGIVIQDYEDYCTEAYHNNITVKFNLNRPPP